MNKYNKNFALPNEVWSPVKGYEGLYAVSSMGRVKNLRTGKILKPSKTKNGYLKVNLWKNGKCKQTRVHRLVAEAFLGNPGNKPCVNHLDEVKTSNHYSNLEFCTHKENNNYGTHNERVAETLTNGKLAKKVYQYALNGEFIKEWSSTHEVERQLGYANQLISRCCLDKRPTAYGFKWSYKKSQNL